MGNKRISQLVELTSNQVQLDDLFAIVDITARETKKIKASELSLWLNASGSINSIHSINSDTASYILGSGVNGTVSSSSFSSIALNAISSSFASLALNAISSSFSRTASFALNAGASSTSASYLIYSGFANGTSSFSLKSSLSDFASTAGFLQYFGGNNGTASFAIATGDVVHADTASYFDNFGSVASASHADVSDRIASDMVGTSSIALQALSLAGSMNNYGVFPCTQSLSSSIINKLSISSSLGTPQQTLIQTIGNSILYFTSSINLTPSLSLVIIDRLTGVNTLLDSTIVSLNTTPVLNLWGSLETGSITIPFDLIGQSSLYGEYMVEVTSSSPSLVIDSNRNTKFLLSSKSDTVNILDPEDIQFSVTPSSSVTFSFYSAAGGPFSDHLPGLLQTGSRNILSMSVVNQGVQDIRYTYLCSNLNTLDCSNNFLLTNLRFNFPSSLRTLNCYSCSLFHIADLTNTTCSYINCSYNYFTNAPQPSVSTSYFDISNNFFLSSLPTLPDNLRVLYAQSTPISSLPSSLPTNLRTASFNNTSINTVPILLPTSMSYLDISNTQVASLHVFSSISMSYLNIRNTVFNSTSLETVTSELVSNNFISGVFDMRGYGNPSGISPLLVSNIVQLMANGWTVLYDP